MIISTNSIVRFCKKICSTLIHSLLMEIQFCTQFENEIFLNQIRYGEQILLLKVLQIFALKSFITNM